MPTSNRPSFAAHSYRRFLAQTWERRSLLIVNSGAPLDGLGRDDDRVLELSREPRGETPMENFLQNCRLGIHTIAAEIPTATHIAMWEDDDWYANWRLEDQLEHIGDHGAHGYDFGHVYHLIYRQAMFFRPRSASYGATTMLSVPVARSLVITPDLMMWRNSLAQEGILEDDERKIPFVNVKHALGPTASGMHARESWPRQWDGRDRDWFRKTVGEDSFAFYEQARSDAMLEAVANG